MKNRLPTSKAKEALEIAFKNYSERSEIDGFAKAARSER
jgi:hypothetical protein